MMSDAAKAKAFDYCIRRGFLNPSQMREAQEFGAAVNGRIALIDIRKHIRSAASEADKEGNRERHHALLNALAAVDDAQEAT